MYKNVVYTLFHIGVEESNLNRLVYRWSNKEDRISHWRALTSKQTNSIGSNGKPQRTSSTKPKSYHGMFGLISGINLGTRFTTRMVRGWAPGVTLLDPTGRTRQKKSEPKRLSTAPKSQCGVYIAPKSTTLSLLRHHPAWDASVDTAFWKGTLAMETSGVIAQVLPLEESSHAKQHYCQLHLEVTWR